ncbi:MAG: hypothetical protein D6722_28455 [Bacteroidetes bacterium]|nr:MAG: hypothetical protein D6722_28455 [Bacteroidota bacterium]
MSADPNPYDRLDAYLVELEAHERRRRRQRGWLMLAGGLLIVLAGGLGYGWASQAPVVAPRTDLRRFAMDTLRPAQAMAAFAERLDPILVSSPDGSWDTLADMEAYYALFQALQPEPPATPVPGPTARLSLAVQGDFLVKEPLKFEISPWDSIHQLVLDFGNGVRRVATGPAVTYAYPLPGHFEMHLLQQHHPDSLEILHTLMYEVRADTLTEISAIVSVPAHAVP